MKRLNRKINWIKNKLYINIIIINIKIKHIISLIMKSLSCIEFTKKNNIKNIAQV